MLSRSRHTRSENAIDNCLLMVHCSLEERNLDCSAGVVVGMDIVVAAAKVKVIDKPVEVEIVVVGNVVVDSAE